MHAKKAECQKPQELKEAPAECTAGQIKKCHGDAAEHPCTKDDDGEA